MKFFKSLIRHKFVRYKNGSTHCAICGAPCQGFKAPDGKIICADCYYKIYGERP